MTSGWPEDTVELAAPAGPPGSMEVPAVGPARGSSDPFGGLLSHAQEALAGQGRLPRHPLLGPSTREAASEIVFRGEISPESAGLAGHVVHQRIVCPAAVYLDLAVAASRVTLGDGPWALLDVEIGRAMLLHPGESLELLSRLVRRRDDQFEFTVTTRRPARAGGPEETLHCRATIGRFVEHAPRASAWQDVGADVDVEQLYRRAATLRGLQYGDGFRGIRQARFDGEVLCGFVEIPPGTAAGCLIPHALLDSAFQLVEPFLPDRDGVYLPVSVSRLQVLRAPGRTARVLIRPAGAPGRTTFDLELETSEGDLSIACLGLCVRRASRKALSRMWATPGPAGAEARGWPS